MWARGPHVNPPGTYPDRLLLSAQGRRRLLLRSAPRPPRQTVLDTWARRANVGPSPRRSRTREGSRAFAAKQNKGFPHHSAAAQSFTLSHAALSPLPSPPPLQQRRPSPSASFLPSHRHLYRGGGRAECRVAPAAASEEGSGIG